MKSLFKQRHRRFHAQTLEPRRLLAGDVTESVVGRIVGGQETTGKFGWVASLQDGFGHFCGGTLISRSAIVTAAHCVEGVASNSVSVVLGRSDLGQSDGQRINVDRIISHPSYNGFTNDSDIAILLLASQSNEQPIGFLTESNAQLANAGADSLVLGWGATDEGGPTTTRLQAVEIPIVSNETANALVSYDGDITENMLAAGRASGGIDSCQGDSGGPLVVFDEASAPLLAGVVSWGEGCARPNKYGIYARVAKFAEWIGENAELESPKGSVSFSPTRFLAGSTATLSVEDSDLADRDWIEVPVTAASGDTETVRLASFAAGRFRGTVEIVSGDSVSDNGILEVSGEEQITVTYLDADDGTGSSQQVTAVADVVEDDFGNGTATAGLLSADMLIEGEIDVIGDRDWFQLDFPPNSGFDIRVDLDEGTLDDSILSLFAADGETLLAIDDDGGRGLGSEIEYFSLQDARTVFVEIAGYGANLGTYTITVNETDFENDDHFNVFSLGTSIAAGEQIAGDVNYPQDEDWFQFEAEAGVLYQASVTLDGLDDSQLRVVDKNGRKELLFNDDRSDEDLSSRAFFFVDEPGTYYLEVGGYQDETGTYQIAFDESEDDHGNLPVDATELGAITTEVEFISGEITVFDEDWFSFSADAGTFYEFETVFAGGSDALRDTQLRVFDETGQIELAVNDDHLDRRFSKIVWQAPRDGEFHAQVIGFRDDVGVYDLEFRELVPAPTDDVGNLVENAMQVDAPETVTGTINYEADFDLFRIEAVQGSTYFFDMELGTLEDSLLRVLAADGQTVLAENDDATSDDLSSYLEWTAPETGFYFVRASGFDGHLGSYRVHSEIFGDMNEDGLLSVSDIDTLLAEVQDGSANAFFDLNADDNVDNRDLELLIRDVFHTVRGDVDLNGAVEFADFLAMSANFGKAGTWENGDFSGNGSVDFADFLLLSRNFGTTSETPTNEADPPQFDDGLLAALKDAKQLGLKNRLYVNPK